MGQATLFLMVGLPGSGKTTRAKELERETGAIRFTPDEWHLFLFGDDFHDPQEHELHNQRHDKVEALMWQVGKRLLAQGVSVILDFGFWAKEQREKKFREAQALGAGFAICYVHAPLEELCPAWSTAYRRGARTCSRPSAGRTWSAGPPCSSRRTRESCGGNTARAEAPAESF